MREPARFCRIQRGLYGIADVDALEARDITLEEGIRFLLAAGAPVVQIRWKNGSAGPLLEGARLLVELCRKYEAVSIVNDRVDVAVAAGARGVHLGQEDLSVEAARGILPKGVLIGVSTHDLGQVNKAIEDGADYIGFGPVFSTSTKANPDPVVGIEGLETAVRRVAGRVPVVAIGGIDLARADEVADAGADLAASILDIIEHADPGARARALHEAMAQRKGGGPCSSWG